MVGKKERRKEEEEKSFKKKEKLYNTRDSEKKKEGRSVQVFSLKTSDRPMGYQKLSVYRWIPPPTLFIFLFRDSHISFVLSAVCVCDDDLNK
jgi:hypothetical protein